MRDPSILRQAAERINTPEGRVRMREAMRTSAGSASRPNDGEDMEDEGPGTAVHAIRVDNRDVDAWLRYAQTPPKDIFSDTFGMMQMSVGLSPPPSA